MVDAPEKIWAHDAVTGLYQFKQGPFHNTEYTRSDLVAEQAAENKRLKQEVETAWNARHAWFKAAGEANKRAMEAEALASADAVKVKVKPLEWREERNCEASSETVVGMYEVGFDDGWWSHLEDGVKWDWEPEQDPRSYHGPDAAKAAAQADYERRILSALEPTPPEGQQEPVAYLDTQGLEKLKSGRGATAYPKPVDTDWQMTPVFLNPTNSRPSEQAVTEAMVEAAKSELFGKGIVDAFTVRAALKAAMEAGG